MSKDETQYWVHGMSEFAIRAYTSGLVPGSKIKGVPALLVKKFCIPKETHVSSKFFNVVKFYDPYEVRAIFGLSKLRGVPPIQEAVEALAKWEASRKKPHLEVITDCVVEWVEYLGRNHFPQAITHRESEAKVEIKGTMATVSLKDGRKMRKRLNSRGFRYWRAAQPLGQLSFKGL
jgi:hypothetical protein